MIDLKLLKQLIKLMSDNGLSELDLQDGEEKVKLKRGPDGLPGVGLPGVGVPGVAQPMAMPQPATIPVSTASFPLAGDAPAEDAGLHKITSPMVGTFYSSPSPDAAAFIKVGDKVGPDTVVCIVEAMKVFNEIKAETSGTIQRVLVDNGQAVEFGQPLFLVKP